MSYRSNYQLEHWISSGQRRESSYPFAHADYRDINSSRSTGVEPLTPDLSTPHAEQPWKEVQSSLAPSSGAYFESHKSAFRTPDYHLGDSSIVPHASWPARGLEERPSYQLGIDPNQDMHRPFGGFLPGHPAGRPLGTGQDPRPWSEPNPRLSPEPYIWEQDSTTSRDSMDLLADTPSARTSSSMSRPHAKGHSQRRPANRDEFDGPHQFLDRPAVETSAMQELELPHIPTNLFVQEQDDVLNQVNDRLSQCAFDFVAKYQFPIPLEPDKRPVRIPQDREWTEWVYLLKRLATKRRIPARVLYNGQIKQLVTVLENSLEMRHAAKHQSRPLKDDRNVLQLISAGLQVAKILKDAATMDFLDKLYVRTESLIQSRRGSPTYLR